PTKILPGCRSAQARAETRSLASSNSPALRSTLPSLASANTAGWMRRRSLRFRWAGLFALLGILASFAGPAADRVETTRRDRAVHTHGGDEQIALILGASVEAFDLNIRLVGLGRDQELQP